MLEELVANVNFSLQALGWVFIYWKRWISMKSKLDASGHVYYTKQDRGQTNSILKTKDRIIKQFHEF